MTSGRWSWPTPEVRLGQWLGICWDTLGRGMWKPPTRGQLALAEIVEQPHLDRVVITGFRGMGKSVVNAAAVTWFWRFISPNLKILVVSASHAKAKDFSFQVKKLLDEVPELEHLRPSGSRGQRQEIDAFDISGCIPEQSRSLRSYGLDGNATGGRADIVICDDIEVPENTRTQHMRERSWSKLQEYFHMLKPKGESPSKFIDLGTPHTEESLHNRLVNESGFTRFLYPALFPDPALQEHMGRDLHPYLRKLLGDNPDLCGEPTDPERFDRSELESRRNETTPRDFQLQFMLDTRLADQDQYPLKINDLMVMDLDEEVGPQKAIYSRAAVIEDLSRDYCVGWDGDRFHAPGNLQDMQFKPYQHKMVFIDPSGRGKDETAYCVLGYVNGYLCILDWGGFVEGYSDSTMTGLVDIATKWGCRGFVVEDNFGNGMFTEILVGHIRKSKVDLGVDNVSVRGRKEERILQTVRPPLEKHRVILNRQVVISDYLNGRKPGNSPYMAMYQMSRMTDEKGVLRHDDRIDALSLGCSYYQSMMAQESDLAIARDEQAELRAWAKKMARPLEGLKKQAEQGKKPRKASRYSYKPSRRSVL